MTQLISYLRLDAQEIFPLCTPEVDLNSGTRVVPPEQQGTRVFLQDIQYLKRPLQCQRLYGIQQATVQGPTGGAEGDRDEDTSITTCDLMVQHANKTKVTCVLRR